MKLSDLLTQVLELVSSGTAPDTPVMVAGCDCTGHAHRVVVRDGVVVIERQKSAERLRLDGDMEDPS